MKIELDINIPEGYEATGEYREAINGEWYSSINLCQAFLWSNYRQTHGRFIILRPKKRREIRYTEDANGHWAEINGLMYPYANSLFGYTRYTRIETTE